MTGKIYLNKITKKFYQVYKTRTNAECTKLFVQFYQVRGFDNERKVNKDKFYIEEMTEFLNSHDLQEDLPPPIPSNLR